MKDNGHNTSLGTQDEELRVAIYARYSSEMQNELSIEDQLDRCREEIARRGWRAAGIYKDSARSGWSLDRDGFQELRAAAEKGKFDAILMWKFDRLARDHNHTVMIKALLRHQYGLKLFCVEGVSEDDDDSPYSALVEQMIAVFAAFYSRNLSTDTKRAKRARAMRGEYNGSTAPIGYVLVTKTQAASEDRPAGLYVDPEVAPVVAEAFERYATRRYSDRLIAEWMNEQPAIQKFCEGRRPVGKEMVRDMLQNRLYTGRVAYAETIYNSASLGQKKTSSRGRKEWFEGRHDAIISDEVYDACQAVRERMASTRRAKFQSRTYILPDRVYCAHCIAREHDNISDPYYGKIRIAWHNRDKVGHYRCVSRDRGFGECEQPYVREDVVIDQLVDMLSDMRVPPEALERIDEAVRNRKGNEEMLAQLEELEEQQRRVQFSWEHGRLTPEEYLARTSQLEREIASFRPLDYDNLEEAADLITHFKTYWDQCAGLDEPREARQQLMAKIIDRVFLYNDSVVAVALHPDFGIVLDVPDAAPDQILRGLATNKNGYTSSEVYPVRERRDSNPRSPA